MLQSLPLLQLNIQKEKGVISIVSKLNIILNVYLRDVVKKSVMKKSDKTRLDKIAQHTKNV